MQVGVKCNTIKVGLDRAQWTYIHQSQGLVFLQSLLIANRQMMEKKCKLCTCEHVSCTGSLSASKSLECSRPWWFLRVKENTDKLKELYFISNHVRHILAHIPSVWIKAHGILKVFRICVQVPKPNNNFPILWYFVTCTGKRI